VTNKRFLTKKEAMYIAWVMAVTRKLVIFQGAASEENYDKKLVLNDFREILKTEGWTQIRLTFWQVNQITTQSNLIYEKKSDEVNWAVENMYLSREELKGVGSLVAPPHKFESNLFDDCDLSLFN
tara:strand:+ start:1270 stop:1644 length:375 start_codon:yes stop_codon:yes gene_type:complete